MAALASPLRYPGGKSRIAEKLVGLLDPSGCYCEPFVGGGSVALAVASSRPARQSSLLGASVERLVLNDADPDIAAFWSVVVGDAKRFERFIARIAGCRPTVDMWREVREGSPRLALDRAFRLLFLNRTSFSGIARSGPIGGYDQRSEWTVDCRWTPATLEGQLRDCRHVLAGRTTVLNVDFSEVGEFDCAYVDPPYYEKGDQLYEAKMAHEDHERLAVWLRRSSGRWLLTYDDHPDVERLYGWASTVREPMRYSIRDRKNDWRAVKELFISSVPAWRS